MGKYHFSIARRDSVNKSARYAGIIVKTKNKLTNRFDLGYIEIGYDGRVAFFVSGTNVIFT